MTKTWPYKFLQFGTVVLNASRGKLIKILALVILSVLFAPDSYAVDEDNCLFCHRYRGLGYIDRDREFRLLYITEDHYENSPHGILKCSDCHQGIVKFPHTEVKKVDCLIECHLDEPSSKKPFSHQKVAQILAESKHSKFDKHGNLKAHPEDYPECLSCHTDPLYRPLMLFDELGPGILKKTITRCSICHEKRSFMRKFYSHFTSRMQKLRKPRELVEMCSKCHEDPDLIKRHNLRNAVYSYNETYHGKAVYSGDERAADCNDCHTRPDESVHSIKAKDDPESATYESNRSITCADFDCHPGADANLAAYNPHIVPDPKWNFLEYCLLVFFSFITIASFGTVMLFNVLDMSRKIFPDCALENLRIFKKRIKKSP